MATVFEGAPGIPVKGFTVSRAGRGRSHEFRGFHSSVGDRFRM